MNSPVQKSGYIAIVGRPNVGKSTLLNALLGETLAAVSSKPQTTRHKILGIKNLPGAQMLFLDTPGIHKPHRRLNEYMVEIAESSFQDADIFLFVTEPADEVASIDREIYEKIRTRGKPVIVVINKVDRVYKKKLLPQMETYLRQGATEVIPVSALNGDGMDRIEEALLRVLPEGPCYYPEDQMTDRSERFLVAEIIRRHVMESTRQEVPYAVAVIIEEFKEPKAGDRSPLTRIRAMIVVDKDSQKGILIGAKGQMIRKIGEMSRLEIEKLLETKVYLELFVRVEREWTQDGKKVEEFLEG